MLRHPGDERAAVTAHESPAREGDCRPRPRCAPGGVPKGALAHPCVASWTRSASSCTSNGPILHDAAVKSSKFFPVRLPIQTGGERFTDCAAHRAGPAAEARVRATQLDNSRALSQVSRPSARREDLCTEPGPPGRLPLRGPKDRPLLRQAQRLGKGQETMKTMRRTYARLKSRA